MSPGTIADWLTVAAVVLGLPFAMWRTWASMMVRINGLGDRLNVKEREDKEVFGRLDAKLDGLDTTLRANQQRTVDLVLATTREFTEALHTVDKDVVRVKERTDVAECFDKAMDRLVTELRSMRNTA